MARPNDNLFNTGDRSMESRIKKVIDQARKKPGPGTNMVVDAALDELSNLYALINKRAGK